jgi:outer membrane protein OmpA-like peptidoglycan-associated protein
MSVTDDTTSGSSGDAVATVSATNGATSSVAPKAKVPKMAPSGSMLGDPTRRRRLAAGLIAAELLLLTGAVAVLRRSSIEDRIASSVSDAISIDYPGLKVSVDGRDVTIRGAVTDPNAKAKIAAIARRRPGVRTVDIAGLGAVADLDPANTGTTPDGTPVPTTSPLLIRPPQVTATFSPTAIVVAGDVPSTEAKDALLGRLRASQDSILSDKLTVAAKPTERADLAEYRRVGTFLDTIARVGVTKADVNFDRTILTLTAEVGSTADRDLLRREGVVLVGGDPSLVRGQISLTGDSADTTVAGGSTDSVAASSTTEAGGVVTVPPIPSTPEAQAAQTAITTAIGDRTISFNKNSSVLSTEGKAIVADVAAALTSSTAKVEIGGHTDARGREALNQTLSQERADAIRDALIAAGIDGSRVTAKGYGEAVPIGNNNTEPGRAKNRRIELRVVG